MRHFEAVKGERVEMKSEKFGNKLNLMNNLSWNVEMSHMELGIIQKLHFL